MWVKIGYWQTILSQNVPLCIGSNLLKALLSSICVDQIWRRFNFHHFMMIIDPIEILENCNCKTLFYFQIYHEFYWNLELIVACFKCNVQLLWFRWIHKYVHILLCTLWNQIENCRPISIYTPRLIKIRGH